MIHFPQRSDHAFFAASPRSHDLGQAVMGAARASGARRAWGVFGGRQSRGHGNLRAKVATGVALHRGMIREPEHEAFFQLAPERVRDRGTRAYLEALRPPRTAAPCKVEPPQGAQQIDATGSRYTHTSPSVESGEREQIGRLNQSRDKAHIVHLPEEVYPRESGFSRDICPSAHASRRVLTRRLKTCSLVGSYTLPVKAHR